MISEEELSRAPTDSQQAENYAALYRLWRDARCKLEFATAGEKEFEQWDLDVQNLLDPAERESYLSPYDGLDLRYFDYRTVSSLNRLTKILINRQGIKAPDPK